MLFGHSESDHTGLIHRYRTLFLVRKALQPGLVRRAVRAYGRVSGAGGHTDSVAGVWWARPG